eukprot:1284911-Prymnesium_polylepis.1
MCDVRSRSIVAAVQNPGGDGGGGGLGRAGVADSRLPSARTRGAGHHHHGGQGENEERRGTGQPRSHGGESRDQVGRVSDGRGGRRAIQEGQRSGEDGAQPGQAVPGRKGDEPKHQHHDRIAFRNGRGERRAGWLHLWRSRSLHS